MAGPDSRLTPYLDAPRPLAMAHRGGPGLGGSLGVENTMAAFAAAVALGYRYLETDVRATRDGVPVLVHDASLDRLAGESVRVADLTYAQLRHRLVGGREQVPTLAELLAAYPGVRLNIDVKNADAIEPTVRAVRNAAAEERVCLASFSDRILTRVRALAGPRVTTSCSATEVLLLRFSPLRRHQALGRRRGASCVQVPWRSRGLTIVTPGFVRRAHSLGLQVHVWTVDDEPSIRALLGVGADGLIADQIDVLADVLRAVASERGRAA